MLTETLRSIKEHEPTLLQNTFIVDDGSPIKDKGTILTNVALDWGCKVYFKASNSGYSQTVNRGIALCRMKKCDFVVTLNSDCEITSPFKSIAQRTFEADPLISVIGGTLYYPSGKIQSAGQLITKEHVEEHFKNQYAKEDIRSTRPAYVHSVTGAMQIFKLDAGLYDERFRMAYEDVEFCIRQWQQGKRVFYQPHIKAIHREGATRGRFPSGWELESIRVFNEVRKATNVKEHEKQITALNNIIHKRQVMSPR